MTVAATQGLLAVIGLGSNLGDSRQAVLLAAQEVSTWGTEALTSTLRVTAPVGPPQPDFVNAAVALRFSGTPLELLDRGLTLERRFGRVRSEHWGPRTLDVDVLWIEGLIVEDLRLRVPHPELTRRAFALIPLLEVIPSALDPRTGLPYRLALEALNSGSADAT